MKAFTKELYDYKIVLKTEKVRELFPLKEKISYPSCKIYKGACSSKKNFIGEIKRNVITSWNDHEYPIKDSEPAKQHFQQPDHDFQWKVLMSSPMNVHSQWNIQL